MTKMGDFLQPPSGITLEDRRNRRDRTSSPTSRSSVTAAIQSHNQNSTSLNSRPSW